MSGEGNAHGIISAGSVNIHQKDGERAMSNELPRIEDYTTVAAAWIHSASERFVEDAWESFPDIGQYDIDRIVSVMMAMLPADTFGEKFNEAYARFAAAAEKVDDE